MNSNVPEEYGRVLDFIESSKIQAKVRVLAPESTRTSKAASEVLGCSVAEIAKTIGFLTAEHNPVLVILSGDKRVDVSKLEEELTSRRMGALRKMSAEEVKSRTGYSIGGVPPFPHRDGILLLADDSLFRFEKVWAAAGNANSVMQISPAVLKDNLNYRVVNVSE